MQVSVGVQAESELAKVRGSIPSQDVTGDTLVTSDLFVRAARCVVLRPGSYDQLAAWSDSVAQLRHIVLDQGEYVLLRPSGICSIFSAFPITPQASTAVNDVPNWLSSGCVAIDLADSGGLASPAANQQGITINTAGVPEVFTFYQRVFPNGKVLALAAYFDRLPFLGIPWHGGI